MSFKVRKDATKLKSSEFDDATKNASDQPGPQLNDQVDGAQVDGAQVDEVQVDEVQVDGVKDDSTKIDPTDVGSTIQNATKNHGERLNEQVELNDKHMTNIDKIEAELNKLLKKNTLLSAENTKISKKLSETKDQLSDQTQTQSENKRLSEENENLKKSNEAFEQKIKSLEDQEQASSAECQRATLSKDQEYQTLVDKSKSDVETLQAEMNSQRKKYETEQEICDKTCRDTLAGKDEEWRTKLEESSAQYYERLRQQHRELDERYQRLLGLLGNNRKKRGACEENGEQLRRLVEVERKKLNQKYLFHGIGHHAAGGAPAGIGQSVLFTPFGGYLN